MIKDYSNMSMHGKGGLVMKNIVIISLTILIVLPHTLAFAMDEAVEGTVVEKKLSSLPEVKHDGMKDEDIDAFMMGDALFVRPVGLASVVAGTAIFIIAFPFAALGGNVDKVAKELVINPVNYTFKRPIGEFDYHQ